MRLKRAFFEKNTEIVARELLGKILANGPVAGKIVETEAYFGEKDPASHASAKSKKRSRVMYGPPGHAYVYFTYGNHWMFNVVTEQKGTAGAVLIRSLEPLKGIEFMKKRRKTSNLLELCSGPAKLTSALAIGKTFNAKSLSNGPLCILDSKEKPSRAKEELLRFYIKGNKFVSKK
ncbi:MAG: DNA-3-methyladenine glycosylase [Candidatus Diapherotrites archaeon]|nr:DNA-3-methyladenine glycosylase [Candidatus Diapherotrites archaeon]